MVKYDPGMLRSYASVHLGVCCKYIFMLAEFIMEVYSIKEYVENICQCGKLCTEPKSGLQMFKILSVVVQWSPWTGDNTAMRFIV